MSFAVALNKLQEGLVTFETQFPDLSLSQKLSNLNSIGDEMRRVLTPNLRPELAQIIKLRVLSEKFKSLSEKCTSELREQTQKVVSIVNQFSYPT